MKNHGYNVKTHLKQIVNSNRGKGGQRALSRDICQL